VSGKPHSFTFERFHRNDIGNSGIFLRGATIDPGNGMIGRDYFRRQATTLRKMVRITGNRAVADRLNTMADDFEARSTLDSDASKQSTSPGSTESPEGRE